jgi:hypothetical protein
MQGFQTTYRITPATTTALTQALTATADIVHVADASALTLPVLSYNQWGILTVNGERIMYRERDLINNTVSSLIRGTAGTAAADHAIDSTVYNMSRVNDLPQEYQNYIVSDNILADGVLVSFEAPNVTVDYTNTEPYDSTEYDQGNISNEPLSYDYGEGNPEDFVEVYLGGIRVTTGFIFAQLNPVIVQFDTPPPDGIMVTILVRRGVWWYNIATPAEREQSLQESQNGAARFLRGQ